MSEFRGSPDTRVQVLVRENCHLCEDAVATVRTVCADEGIAFELIDIDADAELCEEYTDQVPVTFVDGRRHDFWRVDPVRLRAALAAGN